MAALLLGLRLRQLGRTLAGSRWAIVTFVFAVLGAVGLLGAIAMLLAALRVLAPEAAPDAVVLLGSALVIGWAVASLLLSADDALAPERFSMLPVPAARLLPGVLLAGAIGVGGIATLLALLLTLIGWSVSAPATVAAVLLLPLQLATCLLAGRALSSILARQLSKRGGRDLMIVIGSVVGISAGVLVPVVAAGVSSIGTSDSWFGAVTDVLAWTPVGAAWGVPHAVAAGDAMGAAARLLIALVTAVLLWQVWAHDFGARLTAPLASGGGSRTHSGAWLDRLLPSTPVGAIAARGLRYRLRDPRHLVNVIGVPLVPLLVLGMNRVVSVSFESPSVDAAPDLGAAAGIGAMLMPLFGALVLMTIAQLDAAYDNSAVAAHVLTGISGTQDRAGRALGMVALFGPLLIATALVSTAIAGRWDLLPGSLGATLGTAGVVVGVGAAISPWMPGQTPAPEASPFGAGSSGGAQALLGALVMMAATLTVGAPAIGTAIASAWIPWLGWLSLALGLAVGALAIWLGVRLGGRALDRRWPELLAAVSRAA
ncbi:hypothetical protein [Agrococcus sp. ProA11]|uniref:hypothetical protein n=1 Tax=Agrococcus chionoecetis TaxID=3153752 RepID=UPI00326011A1